MNRPSEDPSRDLVPVPKVEVINGVHLHWVEAGEGPLVVLLHGFPEFWYSWRYQIPVLIRAGFRVVALDMRGYNLSGKPKDRAAYRIRPLTQDVVGLIEHLGAKKAVVVGHDWGGAVAWNLAEHHADLLNGLVVLNAPPIGAFRRGLRRPSQLLRSWYVFFFQLPWLPEKVLSARDYRALEWVFRRDPQHRGLFSDKDLARYKTAVGQPGALKAMINYYRAAFRGLRRRGRVAGPRISVPTLVIWGDEDRYLGTHFVDDLARWVEKPRIERISYAAHWVQLDAKEKVNQLLLQFLEQRHRPAAPRAAAQAEGGTAPGKDAGEKGQRPPGPAPGSGGASRRARTGGS